ncbi:hypothetical protein [Campylobacter sputorum]
MSLLDIVQIIFISIVVIISMFYFIKVLKDDK